MNKQPTERNLGWLIFYRIRTGLGKAYVAQLNRREYSVMLDYCLHTDAAEPYDQKPYTVTTPMVEAR